MAIERPEVLPVFASEAADNVKPSNSELSQGWPNNNTPPSRQRFNWLFNYLFKGLRYLLRRGIADWDASETYETGDKVVASDGKTYRAKRNNTNKQPATQGDDWELWGLTLAQVGERYAPINSPVFTGSPTVPTPAANAQGSEIVNANFLIQKLPDLSPYARTSQLPDLTPYVTQQALNSKAQEIINQIPVTPNLSGYAPKASPAFTGSPTAPTPATNDSSDRLATTAMVQSRVSQAVNALPALPLPTSSSSVGQWRALTITYNNNSLPSGGTWAYVLFSVSTSSYTGDGGNVYDAYDSYVSVAAGVAAGGTRLYSGTANNPGIAGLAWRIA